MAADPTPYVLIRCATEMLADLAGNGMSEPLIVMGIEPAADGGEGYELTMRRPSRAELQTAIMARFAAPDRSAPVI